MLCWGVQRSRVRKSPSVGCRGEVRLIRREVIGTILWASVVRIFVRLVSSYDVDPHPRLSKQES